MNGKLRRRWKAEESVYIAGNKVEKSIFFKGMLVLKFVRKKASPN